MSLLNTYKFIPLKISSAKGCYLFDTEGNRYLDTFSGLGVNIIGHSHPEVISSVKSSINKYLHLSNYFLTDEAYEFSSFIEKLTGKSSVFFANSGTEAIEASLKIVRKHFNSKRKSIFALNNAFHGRTTGALSLCWKNNIKDGFDTLNNIQFHDFNSLLKKINSKTAAVYIEPIQGEGGIHPLPISFFEELISLKKKFGFIIVCDEIQSGCYRTGKFLASQNYIKNIDIITLGKGIGGGLPLSACIVSKELTNVLSPGDHGSTFGGNPVACKAGLTTMKIIIRDNLPEKLLNLSKFVFTEFKNLKKMYPEIIKDIRGNGYMIGIEMYSEASALSLKKYMLEHKILINITSKNVWRLLPSYTFNKEMWYIVLNAFNDFLSIKG